MIYCFKVIKWVKMKTRGPLAITPTSKSETLHWCLVRRAVSSPLMHVPSSPLFSYRKCLYHLLPVSIFIQFYMNSFKLRNGFWSVYYLTLSNSLIITPPLLFHTKLPQHLLDQKLCYFVWKIYDCSTYKITRHSAWTKFHTS